MTIHTTIGSGDPLRGTTDHARDLFERLAKECNQNTHEDVVGAAANLLINALRQKCQNRVAAFNALDEVAQKMKNVIGDHYDNAGKRRNVFPFDQVISVPKIDFDQMRKW